MRTSMSRRGSPFAQVSKPWIFVALVGEQPAAIAAALKTWALYVGTPVETWLLATRHVRASGVAGRLAEFTGALGIDSTIVPVSDTLHPAGDERLVWDVGTDLSARADARVVFYADPGLKYLVAALASRLARTPLYLHADTQQLVWIDRSRKVERWGVHQLEDIGLNELLALHGLQGTSDGVLPPPLANVIPGRRVPPGLSLGLDVSGASGSARFDLAVERRGWLVVLNWAASKEDVRAAQRLPNVLNGLRPLVSVCVSGASVRKGGAGLSGAGTRRHGTVVRRRAAAGGIEVFSSDARSVARWIAGAVKTPGQAVAPEVEATWPAVKQGAGGDGPAVVAWVGTDPSSTLQSLYSFRPGQAWLLFDSTTPAARRTTQRIRSQIGRLPCGDVQFIPSDLFGRGATAKLGVLLADVANVVVDVSPGTNGQVCAVAVLPGARLWSHRSKENLVEALDGSDRRPLVAADVLVQMQARGGRLIEQPENAAAWSPVRVEALARLAAEVARGIARPGAPVDWKIANRARRDARVAGLRLQATPAGAWFEEVVAALFVREGADEVWMNVRWGWGQQPNARADGHHRDELDVVVRWDTQYLVVSCKTSAPAAAPLELDARGTEAVARENVARLAIPILVRPSIEPALIEARLKERRGAVYLDLPAISAPGALRKIVEELVAARRTT